MPASVRVPPIRNLAVEQLSSLKGQYEITNDRDLLEAFADDPALYPLLADAVKALRHSFGDRCVLQIRAQATDEGKILRAIIQLPAGFDGAETALRDFDEDWWLDNCQRSEALLVFDYEIGNGV